MPSRRDFLKGLGGLLPAIPAVKKILEETFEPEIVDTTYMEEDVEFLGTSDDVTSWVENAYRYDDSFSSFSGPGLITNDDWIRVDGRDYTTEPLGWRRFTWFRDKET